MTYFVDIAILGAGISGLSVADACLQRGKTCAVFDINEPGEGTSGAPGMLVNAATGRRAKKAWEAENGYTFIHQFLNRVKGYSGKEIFHENRVLRPALTKKLAVNFKQSITKYDWPRGWIKWIEKEQINRQYPYINNEYGALLIKNGLTINGELFLRTCSEYLKSEGMIHFYHQKADYSFKNGKWHLLTDNGHSVTSNHLIDARGFHQAPSDEWKFIPLHNIKGQTATFSYSDPLPLRTSISSLGYMAYLESRPKELTVGSTYEHEFDSLEPDQDGLEYLIQKLESTLPEFAESYESVKQWSGVRTTVPDRKPVIGAHPEIDAFYIIGALGSKGLLLGRYIAEQLVSNILEGKNIESKVASNRFFK